MSSQAFKAIGIPPILCRIHSKIIAATKAVKILVLKLIVSRCQKRPLSPASILRQRQVKPSAKPTAPPINIQPTILTNSSGIFITLSRNCGLSNICTNPPEVIPIKSPNTPAILRGIIPLLKLRLNLVGLLKNISVATMPTAREIAIQGNNASSGNFFNQPRSLRINCPMLQPINADVMPDRIYKYILIISD